MASVIPSEIELTIILGDDYLKDFRILTTLDPETPMDLTGYTINAEIRAKQDFTSTLIATFDINITDAEDGRFSIGLDKTVTEAITQDVGFFDIKLTDGTDFTETYIYGSITFQKSVTDVIP
jgi:hypothetical protein